MRLKHINEYRTTSALMDALESGDSKELIETVDKFGNYNAEGNYKKLGRNQANFLIDQWRQLDAEINKVNQSISESGQNITESESRVKLNELEAKLLDFKTDLAGFGLNETTTKILEMLIKLMVRR